MNYIEHMLRVFFFLILDSNQRVAAEYTKKFFDNTSVDYSQTPIEEQPLYQPPLEEVAKVLSDGLRLNFDTVSVDVVDCPDLTKKPFTLAAPGFGGRPQLLSLGGMGYFIPMARKEKLYDLKKLMSYLNRDSGYIAGAAAGPWPVPGVCCEGVMNFAVKKNRVKQGSRLVYSTHNDTKYKLELVPETETRCAILADLILSDGAPGKVLRVICKKRIGSDDFVTSIRETLQKHYKEKVVGLGGTFLLKEGKVLDHVAPDFSKTPIESEEAFNEWLNYFEMQAPLIHLGTLVSGDLGLGLRGGHFHCFSHHGDGGHYHYDTTPDTAEYVGYFALGESVIRVDAPDESQCLGTD